MTAKKLKNAPLKEAIFELLWELPLDSTGFPVDEEFDVALGKFATEIQKSFPIHKRLFPPGNVLKIYPRPGHQFWKGEITWPVVQFGPGILSVNETEKNYSWLDNYRDNIQKTIEILCSCYTNNLKFNRIKLLYIDAVDFDESKISASEFVRKNLRTSISTEYQLPGKMQNINIGQSYLLDNDTVLHLSIQNGINNSNGKPCIIWTTTIERNKQIEKIQLVEWLDSAHNIASQSFVNILNPDFYADLDR